MLSASSSFMATNCPDIVFATCLAVTGGRADDSTMAMPGWVAQLVPALDMAITNAGRVANDCTMLAACLPIWLIVAMLAMTDAGGRVPRGTLRIVAEVAIDDGVGRSCAGLGGRRRCRRPLRCARP